METSGFFKCECGKLHSLASVSATTVCSCDARLWPQAMRAATANIAARVERAVPPNKEK